jgi:hypothetical protein
VFRILSERMRLPSHSSNEGSDGGAQVFHPSPEQNITVIWDAKYWVLNGFFEGFFKYFFELFSTASFPTLRSPCVGGCWDRTQAFFATLILAVRRSNHLERSHPPSLYLIHNSTRSNL